jgi:hypothetical protein
LTLTLSSALVAVSRRVRLFFRVLLPKKVFVVLRLSLPRQMLACRHGVVGRRPPVSPGRASVWGTFVPVRVVHGRPVGRRAPASGTARAEKSLPLGEVVHRHRLCEIGTPQKLRFARPVETNDGIANVSTRGSPVRAVPSTRTRPRCVVSARPRARAKCGAESKNVPRKKSNVQKNVRASSKPRLRRAPLARIFSKHPSG